MPVKQENNCGTVSKKTTKKLVKQQSFTYLCKKHVFPFWD